MVVTPDRVGWCLSRARRKWRDDYVLRLNFSNRKRRRFRGTGRYRERKLVDRMTVQKNWMHHIRKRHGFVRKGSTLADARPGKTHALVSYGILCFGYVIAIRDL